MSNVLLGIKRFQKKTNTKPLTLVNPLTFTATCEVNNILKSKF